LPPIVVELEVVWRLVGTVVHQPSTTKRTVSYVCDAELASGRDKTIRLVKCLERRILCLHCVDSGHCGGC
jgi:hypothetical protein